MARQVILGVFLGALTNAVDLYLTYNQLPGWRFGYWIILILVFMIATIGGVRLYLWIRVWATTEIFIWGALAVNYGRTFGVHLTIENLYTSVLTFVYLWPIFLLPLFRLWNGVTRLKLFILAPFFAFSVGLGLASLEETLYIRFNSEGTGSTTRWFVNTSGMSYAPMGRGGQPVLRGWD